MHFNETLRRHRSKDRFWGGGTMADGHPAADRYAKRPWAEVDHSAGGWATVGGIFPLR